MYSPSFLSVVHLLDFILTSIYCLPVLFVGCVQKLYIIVVKGCVILLPEQLLQFLARDVIYASRAYATMSVSICLSVCLSVCDRSALAHYS